jgi:hypothetical protein
MNGLGRAGSRNSWVVDWLLRSVPKHAGEVVVTTKVAARGINLTAPEMVG